MNGMDNGLISPRRKTSVTKGDFATDGVINFLVPAYGSWGNGQVPQLPQKLPPYSRTAFFTKRDVTALSTRQHEPMWANAVSVAATKATSWGWEVEGQIPLRRKRAQAVFMNATAGIFRGFIPFMQAHLSSYSFCGYGIAEIERETRPYGSRVKTLHHLNPLRCQFTDDPETPVLYFDKKGRVHKLKYWQVVITVDGADPTLGELGMVESAVQRVYSTIVTMATIERYLYEKVSGNRALALHFIQGLTNSSLEDAIKSAEAEQSKKGAIAYKGAVTVPIMGDVPITRVTIPLAEIPDAFKAQELKDDANVKYANGLGLDVNDVDPRLAARQSLGSGAQSVVLDNKAKGKGFASWKGQWIHQTNYWVLDTSSKFVFTEESLDDEIKRAQKRQAELDIITGAMDKGLATVEEGRNLAVDSEVLPRDFVTRNDAGGNKLADDDKQTEDGGTAVPQQEEATREKEADETRRQRARRLLNEEMKTAVSMVATIQPDSGERIMR